MPFNFGSRRYTERKVFRQSQYTSLQCTPKIHWISQSVKPSREKCPVTRRFRMLTSSVFSLSYLSVYLAMPFALDSAESDYCVFVTAAIRFQIPLDSELLAMLHNETPKILDFILFYPVLWRTKRDAFLFLLRKMKYSLSFPAQLKWIVLKKKKKKSVISEVNYGKNKILNDTIDP